jgi:predicted GTPase
VPNQERNPPKLLQKYKIGVFGETGTGKSTLCNSLLEREAMRVSDIVPVTRRIQAEPLFVTNKFAVELQDFPGIGETIEGDKKYESIYSKAFEDLDVIVWILRADVRNYSLSQKYLDKAVEISMNGDKEFFVALSMVDRLGVPDDWDEVNCTPRRMLLITIERKIMYISGVLGIPPEKIQPISSLKGYNVNILRSDILGHINKIHK